jgi:hypothetical protein
MKRRRQDEKIVPLRLDRMEELTPLASMSARWTADNVDCLKDADPAVPNGLQNREADNWRPLLAIADLAGGHWPIRARKIAESLAASNRGREQSAGIMLLADILMFFNGCATRRMTSAELAVFLAGIDGHPWSDWKAGKPITAKAIANLLAPFNIAERNEGRPTGSARVPSRPVRGRICAVCQQWHQLNRYTATLVLSENSIRPGSHRETESSHLREGWRPTDLQHLGALPVFAGGKAFSMRKGCGPSSHGCSSNISKLPRRAAYVDMNGKLSSASRADSSALSASSASPMSFGTSGRE